MCDGRDVNVSIKDDQLALEVRLAPMAYVYLSMNSSVSLLSKNSQQYLVESNCEAGALAKGLKSPAMEEYEFLVYENTIIVVTVSSSLAYKLDSVILFQKMFYLVGSTS